MTTNSRLTAIAAWSAVALSLAALLLCGAVISDAAKRLPGPSLQPKRFGILRLNKKKKFPPSVLPAKVFDRCSPETVKIGTVCMMTSPYPLEKGDIGKNNYFFATQNCAELGGYLPTAAQLIGAAPYVKLAGRIDDNEVTASTDVDPTDGLKDRREMSATLTTTISGGRAAGSQGVSEGSRGDPKAGEPDPAPLPADPAPETLHYITVYDNADQGGFAGGKPVGQPENFRCAFNRAQGRAGALD
ncbi:MAG TPA: hypothetical protein VFS48_09155 [Solirubrobacterales bacterium]|nr:hypothetical protein [Solirubrobacterales bacterium]